MRKTLENAMFSRVFGLVVATGLEFVEFCKPNRIYLKIGPIFQGLSNIDYSVESFSRSNCGINCGMNPVYHNRPFLSMLFVFQYLVHIAIRGGAYDNSGARFAGIVFRIQLQQIQALPLQLGSGVDTIDTGQACNGFDDFQ